MIALPTAEPDSGLNRPTSAAVTSPQCTLWWYIRVRPYTDLSLKVMLASISYKVLVKVDLTTWICGQSLSVSHFILQVEMEFLYMAQGRCYMLT